MKRSACEAVSPAADALPLQDWLPDQARAGSGRLKIVFVVRNALGIFRTGDSEVGGSELKTVQFAKRLAEDPRFDVHFACWGKSDDEFEQHGVNVSVWNYESPALRRFPGLRGAVAQGDLILRLSRMRADVVIQSCAGLETVSAAIAARLSRATFVFWISSIIDVNGKLERDLGRVLGPLYAWSLRRAAHVICQTQEQVQLVERRVGLPSTVVPSMPPPIRSHLNPDLDRTHVLWIGHWTTIKGPERFVELARRFPQLPFEMLVSSRPAELPADLPRNLSLHYGLGPAQVAAHLSRARVLVNTSRSEGFPNTFLEAAMAGTPILSLSANPDDILEKHELGFCAGGDQKLLAIYLKRLLANEKLWRRCSDQGTSYIDEHHDPAYATSVLTNLLTRLSLPAPRSA